MVDAQAAQMNGGEFSPPWAVRAMPDRSPDESARFAAWRLLWQRLLEPVPEGERRLGQEAAGEEHGDHNDNRPRPSGEL